MALVVEDGTGLDDSNGYISESDADAFHTDRGNTKWTDGDSADKVSAIIRASDFIEKRFGRKFRGSKSTAQQAMEWPRSGATDNDGHALGFNSLPSQLVNACAEYALRALQVNVLAPDVPASVPSQSQITGETTGTISPSGELIKDKSVVDVIETEQGFKPFSSGITATKSSLVSGAAIPQYPEADMWLEELLTSSANTEMIRG